MAVCTECPLCPDSQSQAHSRSSNIKTAKRYDYHAEDHHHGSVWLTSCQRSPKGPSLSRDWRPFKVTFSRVNTSVLSLLWWPSQTIHRDLTLLLYSSSSDACASPDREEPLCVASHRLSEETGDTVLRSVALHFTECYWWHCHGYLKQREFYQHMILAVEIMLTIERATKTFRRD